ncbi:NlpC/P60 family protein [Nocardioides sp. YIM 152315]|uniref:C40 family peptidase n=1 Tax=Nocardioides sp. YIM 152315 TaxID=3031760 RepID=UPI0023DACB14|nr:NlpC/P60 family protein [Nocardioides sp. YIM 152315]MDF1602937.1 NlpC/P60 family protein [Nocardioides sp. YIM 152315]
MSTALPVILRACTRTGARALVSGALAVGLLTSAPMTEAHSAPAEKVARHHDKPTHKHKPKHKPSRVERAMRTAVAQKGDPYGYGGAGPNRFDCSGLTFYSFRRAGFGGIPRTSAGQAGFARHIPRAAMRRGDLIFFTGGGGVYHVGVFAGWFHGRRMVLHAPYSGTRVRTDPLWTDSWFAGTLRFR